jgi:hypothetical protein
MAYYQCCGTGTGTGTVGGIETGKIFSKNFVANCALYGLDSRYGAGTGTVKNSYGSATLLITGPLLTCVNQIRIDFDRLDRIRIQEDKNDPQNIKKCRNFMFWSAENSLLRAGGFSSGLVLGRLSRRPRYQ